MTHTLQAAYQKIIIRSSFVRFNGILAAFTKSRLYALVHQRALGKLGQPQGPQTIHNTEETPTCSAGSKPGTITESDATQPEDQVP